MPTGFQASVERRESQGATPKIWTETGLEIPVVVVAVTLSAIAILIWARRSSAVRQGFSTILSRSSTNNTSSRPGTAREVTAEQLAGSTANAANATTANATTANGNTTTTGTGARPRRTRRPRRTPSQVSTTSLPAYMKEPGEQELVIYRGPEDMEDAPIAHTNIVMPLVDEDANESQHSHSRDHSYPPAPDSPNDMPLLADGQDDVDDHDASPDLLRAPPGEGMPTRPSTDTLNASSETGIVSDMVPTATADPRGEAPPYFEVIDLNDDSQRNLIDVRPELAASPPSNPSTSPEPPSTGGSGASSAPRRSTFRSLWQTISASTSASGAPQSASGSPAQSPPGTGAGSTHARAESGLSNTSSSISNAYSPPTSPVPRTSTSRISHRPTPSGSSSILAPFRTLSRQRSILSMTHSNHSNISNLQHNRSNSNLNQLNSPSMISLNSISSPLTHTTIRTEFTYPKGGLTAEQIKLISSRESVGGRFGKPYGPDAVAFAASREALASREGLPDFEEAIGSDVNLTRMGAGSRLRTDSSAAMRRHERGGSESSLPMAPEPPLPAHSRDSSSSSSAESGQPIAVAQAPQSVDTPNAGAAHQLGEDSGDDEDKKEAAEEASSPSTSTNASSTNTPSLPTTSPPTSAPTSPPSTASSAAMELQTQVQKAKTPLVVAPINVVADKELQPTSSAPATGAPPTSFRAPSTAPYRPESRASSMHSMQSFATAAETLPSSTPVPPSDSEGESGDETDYQTDGEGESRDEEGTGVTAAGAARLRLDTGSKRDTVIAESPSTPKLKSRTMHLVEGTDTTITQNRFDHDDDDLDDTFDGGDTPSASAKRGSVSARGGKSASRQSTMSTMTIVAPKA
ncbi:hypothetical protein PLEOSDRAFT_164825 [Pleurotus ostreatus PC15]|uniref:Uncharacterized protein n=1 Tax=Pleurotus ostreatus (strain PC15) TaxID=1137138 RepID=A0A067NXT4_PLEO1|nr:hypothetical protein PLEOSDRAFT_164825 [Pleurotus ostreatus PC15]